MSQLEAWLVTALGMGVVFVGLMLCIAAINFFNRLARRIKWEGGHGAAETPVTPEAAPAPPAPSEQIEPEVLAVIAAALEIDRRLYLGRQGQRLTLRRTDA
jgi:sodium pump decarboxylase gamma subunit